MRITRLSLWHVRLRSHVDYHMAAGKSATTVETVVLRIDTDAGICGWGEVCPLPRYLPAFARGVVPVVTEIAPALLGADPRKVEALLDRLDAFLIDHRYAKSAIDIALWDILGKVAGLPLFTLLGGRRQPDLPLYHSLTCIAPKEMAQMASEAQAQGMRQIQVKLGADQSVQADIARLTLVREAVDAETLVYGDWNCGATRLHATRVGRGVGHIDVMLEQPCATIEDCAAVRKATGLAMKLDENAHDTESLLRGHALGCMDAVAVKLSKFGGLTRARRARDLCLHLGAVMCVEDTWGSDIATAAALHLGASTPPDALMNVCDLSGYVSPRLAPDAPVRSNGRIVPPDGPGLGIDVDAAALGAPDVILD